MDRLRFTLNGRSIEERGISPTTTLLAYLRHNLHLTGTKEGCAEGDCGACTVLVLDPRTSDGNGAARAPTYRAVNSCLLFLPMLQGKQVYTVEALQNRPPHPVQQALVRALGSQCGYCTPGIVMSMLEACYRDDLTEPWQIDDQMCGNLCRCTGYRPIRDAAREVAGARPDDFLGAALRAATPEPMDLSSQASDRYETPGSLGELFRCMEEHPDARLVAGGTDLALEVTKRFRRLPAVISLEGVAELRRIERHEDRWSVGATATLTELQEAMHGEIPALEKMLRFFASRQIRNRATVGGNLCTASPIGDLAPVLLALGARVRLASATGTRTLALDDFFVAYRKTALRPGEVLASIEIPHPPPDARASSYKVSKRRELDISAVAAGCFVRLDGDGRVREVRLAFGGMAPTPARARAVEEALRGAAWNEASIAAAQPHIDTDFRPLSDHRGSAWFRGRVAKNLLLGFYLETRDRPAPALQDRPTSTVHLESHLP
jgi:xanthine dehydrogenase small subunit